MARSSADSLAPTIGFILASSASVPAQAPTRKMASNAYRRIVNSFLSPAGLDLALIVQQVELGSLLAEAGQDHMRLTAVMCLVVEPVVERRHQRLHELIRRRDATVADDALEPGLVETVDPGDDAPVLGSARGAEVGQALVQDRVQPVRRLALAGEALHPDAVRGQQVVQRAVHRFEEGALVGAVLGIR